MEAWKIRLPVQTPTPPTIERLSQSEVSRTVSANSILGPRRYLISMECARLSLYQLVRPRALR